MRSTRRLLLKSCFYADIRLSCLDFALQVIINKAQDENGQKLFSEGDKVTLRREIPLGVLLELMTKMQELGEEATPDAVKSTDG